MRNRTKTTHILGKTAALGIAGLLAATTNVSARVGGTGGSTTTPPADTNSTNATINFADCQPLPWTQPTISMQLNEGAYTITATFSEVPSIYQFGTRGMAIACSLNSENTLISENLGDIANSWCIVRKAESNGHEAKTLTYLYDGSVPGTLYFAALETVDTLTTNTPATTVSTNTTVPTVVVDRENKVVIATAGANNNTGTLVLQCTTLPSSSRNTTSHTNGGYAPMRVGGKVPPSDTNTNTIPSTNPVLSLYNWTTIASRQLGNIQAADSKTIVYPFDNTNRLFRAAVVPVGQSISQ